MITLSSQSKVLFSIDEWGGGDDAVVARWDDSYEKHLKLKKKQFFSCTLIQFLIMQCSVTKAVH